MSEQRDKARNAEKVAWQTGLLTGHLYALAARASDIPPRDLSERCKTLLERCAQDMTREWETWRDQEQTDE